MDYIKCWRLFWVLCTINIFYCNSVDGETFKYTEPLPTDISTKSFINVPYVTLARPKNIKLTMGDDLDVLFDYNIPCNGLNNHHTIQIESGDPNLFTIKRNAVFQVTCDDADFTHQRLNDTNLSVSDAVHETTMTNAKLVAVEGSVKVTLNGILLGVGTLKVKLKGVGRNATTDNGETIDDGDTDVTENTFNVDVIRVLRPIDEVFRVIVACFISVVIMGFGCSLDLEVVKECLKKPIAPGLGLACQYILMPLVNCTCIFKLI